MTTRNDTPRVVATTKDLGGIWSVRITCPYCGKTHHHGGGPVTEPPVLGHRAAHCLGRGEYEIVQNEGGKGK